ncbi:MAG: hypothetical protein RML45_09440 [Acetobacteraceae bacterium]|nr:hypothetical protein [Acetobacteraceae bacterium]
MSETVVARVVPVLLFGSLAVGKGSLLFVAWGLDITAKAYPRESRRSKDAFPPTEGREVVLSPVFGTVRVPC